MADDGSGKSGEGEMRVNQKSPLVSVIIPAYGCADTICQAVDSALAQNVDLEILVLNDGSPDDLDMVMAQYQTNPQVRYLQNPQNMGAAQTRNRGIELARGTYIAFLDADDWWMPDKLDKQLQKMAQEKTVLCASARELVGADGRPTGRVIPVREKITYQNLLFHNCINCSSVLIRTEVAREFRMEHEDSHEDYILWMRILKKYGYAAAVNEPLLKYRLTKSGKSGSKFKSAGMTYRAYRYVGFGPFRSGLLFLAYAANGVRKYGLAYMRGLAGKARV